MADNKTLPDQNKNINNQNYNFNVDETYQNLVTEIQSIRSNVAIEDIISQKLFDNVKDNESLKTIYTKLAKITSNPDLQESRCHAFYRLLGLPIFSDITNDICSPGYYKNDQTSVNGVTNIFGIEQTLSSIIASQNKDGKFYQLSQQRETDFIKKYKKIFKAQGMAASINALSLYYIRIISSSFESDVDDYNDYDILHQTYKVLLINSLNKSLMEYTDQFGNLTTDIGVPITSGYKNIVSINRVHIIKPFIVDPRIDITSGNKRVAAPFLYDKEQTKYMDGVYLNRPIIEQIFFDRFLNKDQNQQGIIQTRLDFLINNYQAFAANGIQFNTLNNIDPYLLEQYDKYIMVLSSMIDRLCENLDIIQKVQKKYHWIPYVNVNGPEGGCTTLQPFLNDLNNLNSIDDNQLLFFQAQSTANSQVTNENPPDLGRISFSGFLSSLNSDNSSSDNKHIVGNNSQTSYERIVSQRNSLCAYANTAIQRIEMIMGEFSGLGLIDIIIVIASLYTLKSEHLIRLVDPYAYNRFIKLVKNKFPTSLNNLSISNIPIELVYDTSLNKQALIQLNNNIKAFYLIAKQLFNNKINGLTNK